MSAEEIESTAYLIGAFSVMALTLDARSALETLRSITCVAPRALRSSACWRDAVVIMGENPESLAS